MPQRPREAGFALPATLFVVALVTIMLSAVFVRVSVDRRLSESTGDYADAAVQWRQVVRIRTKEPAGWMALAQALIKAGDHKAARKTLRHVMDTSWERRFGNVRNQASALLNRIEAPRPPR